MSTTSPTGSLIAELRRLVEYSLWANRQWIEFVYAQPPEQRPRELLGHVVIGENIWFDRVTGESQTRAPFPLWEKEPLLHALEENGRTYFSLLAARPEDIIHFRRASGEEYHCRVIDVVLHLLTHGYHHRGQLAAHYARKGVKYPNTDHINFLLVNRL